MILRSCRNRNHILYIYAPFGCAFSIALKHANKHQQYSLTGRLRISHSAGHPAIPKYHPPMLKVIHPFSRSSSHPKVASTHAEDHPPMLKVIQPSLSIIRPFSGHPTIQKYHPPMLKIIQPPLSIIHPFSRSSSHSAGHPAIPKYHPPIQHFIQEFLNYFLYSFKSHSEFAWSSCHFKAKVILPRLLEKLNFLRSVCPPNFTIGNTLTVNTLTVNTLTLKCLANIGKHTVCIL